MIEFLIGFFVGFVVGGVTLRIVQVIRSTTGKIIINTDDPNDEYMKLKIDCADDLFDKRKKYFNAEIVILSESDNASK